jgi:3-deoxy-D-manno-octulosonate 8-phosphate phosphatase (KDO 8-P phosphatase)
MDMNYKIKLNEIKVFIFDIDGVLTDGNVLLDNGNYLRSLNSKDSYAIQYAAKMGYLIFMITGGSSKEMKNCLENLGVTCVYLSSRSKLKVYSEVKLKHGFRDDQVLYMGDDIPDIPVLSVVGVSSCPKDAAIDVVMCCSYQSSKDGGKGCVRDVLEQTMRAQGTWLQDGAYEW